MNTRKKTVFFTLTSFTKLLEEFDGSVIAAILAHINYFQKAWVESKHDGEIPDGFVFEAYHKVDEAYRLCQIRVGPKHGYRAIVMILDKSSDAYWIYLFKKVKDRQPEDMDRARIVAQRVWDELQKEKK